jgi:hypothetical protein
MYERHYAPITNRTPFPLERTPSPEFISEITNRQVFPLLEVEKTSNEGEGSPIILRMACPLILIGEYEDLIAESTEQIERCEGSIRRLHPRNLTAHFPFPTLEESRRKKPDKPGSKVSIPATLQWDRSSYKDVQVGTLFLSILSVG